MKEEIKQALKELKVILIIILVFLVLAVLIISTNSRIGPVDAFTTVLTQILTAGTGGILGNVFYVVIIFFTIGISFYMFEKFIILLSEIRIGGILMRVNLSSVKDHYIVCGAGRVGVHVAEKLKRAGKKIVIIESDLERAETMIDKGYTVIEGDCVNEELLEKAKIRKAKGLIACTAEDQKNVFLVLTAKDMNPKIKVATRVNDQKAKDEFKRAGADVIVAPEVTGGYELADRIIDTK